MTKQLTLTGYVVQESPQFYRPGYFIYNDPSNDYEHFIERYYRRNRLSGIVKQTVLKEAQAEWKKLKASLAELRQYLELRSGEQPITRLQAPQPPKQVRDFGFRTASETVSDDECVVLDEATSSSVVSSLSECSATFPSAAVAIIDKDKYLQDKRLSQVHKFVTTLCPNVDGILSEDMQCNSDFIAVAFPVAEAFLKYYELYNSYRARKRRHTKSKLQEVINEVEQKSKACAATLSQIATIKLSLSAGLAELSRASHDKNLLVSQLCEQLLLLKNVVTSRKLLNDIRRRIQQQDTSQSRAFEERKRKEVTFQCLNASADLSWDKAIGLLETPIGCFFHGPLSSIQLRAVATTLSGDVATSVQEIATTQDVVGQRELALLQRQLLMLFPVMIVSRGDTSIVVNLHQVVVSPGTFETLLNLDTEEVEQGTSHLHVPTAGVKATNAPSGP